MYKLNTCLSIMLVMAILLAFAGSSEAQDLGRHASPAFPIGAGEKMLVIGGHGTGLIAGSSPPIANHILFRNAGLGAAYPINLPVGTTIKRLLGDFVDQDGSRNLSITFYRVSNADGATKITLRSFDTSSISSSSGTDAKQVVANPMTHTVLQGWTYWVEVLWPAGAIYGDIGVSVIKIIYEP